MHSKWFDWIFRSELRIWMKLINFAVIYVKMKQSAYDKANDKMKTFTLWIQPIFGTFFYWKPNTRNKRIHEKKNVFTLD